jgi:DNA-directed RNA polymerase subunit beta'
MVDELVRATPGKLRRRAAEVIVEGITRHAKITDPGDSDYLPGDIALLSEIQSKNKDLDDKAKYEFLFKGVNFLPQATQSWMSQLNFRYLKNVLNDAIVEGKMSDTHGYEPAAALAFPAEFGEGDEGRY